MNTRILTALMAVVLFHISTLVACGGDERPNEPPPVSYLNRACSVIDPCGDELSCIAGTCQKKDVDCTMYSWVESHPFNCIREGNAAGTGTFTARIETSQSSASVGECRIADKDGGMGHMNFGFFPPNTESPNHLNGQILPWASLEPDAAKFTIYTEDNQMAWTCTQQAE